MATLKPTKRTSAPGSSLADLVAAVLEHPDTPAQLYNLMADVLIGMTVQYQLTREVLRVSLSLALGEPHPDGEGKPRPTRLRQAKSEPRQLRRATPPRSSRLAALRPGDFVLVWDGVKGRNLWQQVADIRITNGRQKINVRGTDFYFDEALVVSFAAELKGVA